MSRAPIQVPEELKSEIESLKNASPLGCPLKIYEVIEGLIRYYRKNEATKEQEKARQETETVNLGPDIKESLVAFRQGMDLRSDADAVLFLLAHYQNSDKLDKDTFDLYRKLR
jgi:hypothetical protein